MSSGANDFVMGRRSACGSKPSPECQAALVGP